MKLNIGEEIVERWMIPRSGIPESIKLIKGGEYYYFLGTAQIASPVYDTEHAALVVAVDKADKARQEALAHYKNLRLLLSRSTPPQPTVTGGMR